MTDKELELWQYLDESRDRIEALEKEHEELKTAFTVFINLIADKMEIDNGLRSEKNGSTASKLNGTNNRRWFKS